MLSRQLFVQNIIFGFVLVFSMLTQCMRWLPIYLSSFTVAECAEICSNVAFTPLCQVCDDDDPSCLDCHSCREQYHSEFYNLEDGICMTTREYGTLTGLGFALTFSIFGLFAGYVGDLCSEWASTLLGASVLLCSVVVFLAAYVTSYHQLLVLRIFLGALQAFCAPASMILVANYYPILNSRPAANTSYTVGIYLGASMATLSSIVSSKYGWRMVFMWVGLFGLMATFVFEGIVDLLLRKWLQDSQIGSLASVNASESSFSHMEFAPESPSTTETESLLSYKKTVQDNLSRKPPGRQNTNPPVILTISDAFLLSSSGFGSRVAAAALSRRTALPVLSRTSGSTCLLGLVLLASALRFSAGIIVFTYIPLLVSRKFPSSSTDETFSLFFATVVLACGSYSAFTGGRLGSWAVHVHGFGGLSRLIIISNYICVIPFIISFSTNIFWVCMGSLAISYLVGEVWMGNAIALLQELSPPGNHGFIISVFLFLNWIASALATDLVAMLDPGTSDLSSILTYAVTGCVFTSTLLFLSVDRSLNQSSGA